MIESIIYKDNKITLLDQTLLPIEEKYISIPDYRTMIEAIKKLRIRGAPAIGIAAAWGIYLAAEEFKDSPDWKEKLEEAISEIEASRPTAVNLFKASGEIKVLLAISDYADCFTETVRDYALKLMEYEKNASVMMGVNGLEEISDNAVNIMTICNTGSLATYGEGTALAVIRALAEKRDITVYACETRPLLQGSRLTMWELMRSGIESRLITDGMTGSIIRDKAIDCIVTGADRIAANGDSANKIGTFNLAVLANHFNIPFYIAAPESTFDRSIKTGAEINIEQRDAEEVKFVRGTQIAPADCKVENPAFDVTPFELITGIITEKKVYKNPDEIHKA